MSSDRRTNEAQTLLRDAILSRYPRRIALVSSFGIESAIVLHLVAQIDCALPILFIDTGFIFAETLRYRDALVGFLKLTNVEVLHPSEDDVREQDPTGFLWTENPDRCCTIRKVRPLTSALRRYDAWITGRKRHQGSTRASLPVIQAEGDHVKINPLAFWNPSELISYFAENNLPRHSMAAWSYPSIGCIPCTSKVQANEGTRSGRWRGTGKSECGIHLPS